MAFEQYQIPPPGFSVNSRDVYRVTNCAKRAVSLSAEAGAGPVNGIRHRRGGHTDHTCENDLACRFSSSMNRKTDTAQHAQRGESKSAQNITIQYNTLMSAYNVRY